MELNLYFGKSGSIFDENRVYWFYDEWNYQ